MTLGADSQWGDGRRGREHTNEYFDWNFELGINVKVIKLSGKISK